MLPEAAVQLPLSNSDENEALLSTASLSSHTVNQSHSPVARDTRNDTANVGGEPEDFRDGTQVFQGPSPSSQHVTVTVGEQTAEGHASEAEAPITRAVNSHLPINPLPTSQPRICRFCLEEEEGTSDDHAPPVDDEHQQLLNNITHSDGSQHHPLQDQAITVQTRESEASHTEPGARRHSWLRGLLSGQTRHVLGASALQAEQSSWAEPGADPGNAVASSTGTTQGPVTQITASASGGDGGGRIGHVLYDEGAAAGRSAVSPAQSTQPQPTVGQQHQRWWHSIRSRAGARFMRRRQQHRAPADNPLIVPCRCRGTSKYVHRQCLQEWRMSTPSACRACPVCGFEYQIRRPRWARVLSSPLIPPLAVLLVIFILLCLAGFLSLSYSTGEWTFGSHLQNGFLFTGWVGFCITIMELFSKHSAHAFLLMINGGRLPSNPSTIRFTIMIFMFCALGVIFGCAWVESIWTWVAYVVAALGFNRISCGPLSAATQRACKHLVAHVDVRAGELVEQQADDDDDDEEESEDHGTVRGAASGSTPPQASAQDSVALTVSSIPGVAAAGGAAGNISDVCHGRNQQQARDVEAHGQHHRQQADHPQSAHAPPDVEQGFGDLEQAHGDHSNTSGNRPTPLPPQPLEASRQHRTAAETAGAAGNSHSTPLTSPFDEEEGVDACLVTSAIAGIKGIT